MANHLDLIKLYREDDATRNEIDKVDANTLFNNACDCVYRFKRLRPFSGVLATISATTTSVESNFFDPEVGAGRISYRPHAPVSERNLPGEVARNPEAGLGLISWHSAYTSCRNTYCSVVRGVIQTELHITGGLSEKLLNLHISYEFLRLTGLQNASKIGNCQIHACKLNENTSFK